MEELTVLLLLMSIGVFLFASWSRLAAPRYLIVMISALGLFQTIQDPELTGYSMMIVLLLEFLILGMSMVWMIGDDRRRW